MSLPAAAVSLPVGCTVAAQAVDVDRDRVAAVRRASATGVRLRLDANRGWDIATASHVVATVAAADIDYVEEPHLLRS